MVVTLKKGLGQGYYEELQKIADKETSFDDSNYYQKALTSDTASSGEEHLPTEMSAEIISKIYEEAWHRQVFNTYVMNTIKEELPRFTNRATGKYLDSNITTLPQADQISETDLNTDKKEIELKTLTMNLQVNRKYVAYNTNPQINEFLRSQLIDGLRETEVDAIINGDASDTHQDSDVEALGDDDHRKAFSGLRKLAGKDVDASNEKLSVSHVRAAIVELDRFSAGGKKAECVLLVNSTGFKHLKDAEQIDTVDKYGPRAAIVSGDVPSVDGIGVIETFNLRTDLNDSGVYDDATKDRTIALLFNSRWQWLGVPGIANRTLGFTVKPEPEFDRDRMIVVEDIGFQTADEDSICLIKNISTTVVDSS